MASEAKENNIVADLVAASEAQTQRIDQVVKLLQETQDNLTKLMDNVTVLIEALRRSLSDSDRSIDDLTAATAALLTELRVQREEEDANA